jgi:carboxyl-terminal processing protease
LYLDTKCSSSSSESNRLKIGEKLQKRVISLARYTTTSWHVLKKVFPFSYFVTSYGSTTTTTTTPINDTRECKSKEGLVIDLRGNLGGTLPSALDVACLFLPRGTVVLQMTGSDGRGDRRRIVSQTTTNNNTITCKNKKQSYEKYYSKNRHADITTPILVLVDENTASASEVLTAALHANKRYNIIQYHTIPYNVM